jgi:hypothetical protein
MRLKRKQKTNLLIDLTLALATALYAAFLQRYSEKRDPDYYWVEVIFGSGLCLAANEIRAICLPETPARQIARWGWRSFMVGGLPVVLWQLWVATQNRATSKAYRSQP